MPDRAPRLRWWDGLHLLPWIFLAASLAVRGPLRYGMLFAALVAALLRVAMRGRNDPG